jgi:hypothetical protein
VTSIKTHAVIEHIENNRKMLTFSAEFQGRATVSKVLLFTCITFSQHPDKTENSYEGVCKVEKSKSSKMSANQINWVIDLVAFVMFFLIVAPQSTGIPVHEWLSVVFVGTFVVHIVAHWQWVVEISKRFLKKLQGENRFNYLWDAFAFLVMTTAIMSGFLISQAVLPTLGMPLIADPFWVRLHDLSANLSLLLLAIHLALHWQWIVNAFNRYVRKPRTASN